MLCFHPQKRMYLTFSMRTDGCVASFLKMWLFRSFHILPKRMQTKYLARMNECIVKVPSYKRTEGDDHVTHKEAPNISLTISKLKTIK